MTENATDTAVADQEFEYPIKVEDAGPATKRVTIEIPETRIKDELNKQFKDLRQHATIPGFRAGHVPAKLLEKKFSNDVKDQVRRNLISESYQQAMAKNKLEPIGEPEFENPNGIELPATGNLSYSFNVEIQPVINLPELKGVKVKKPKIEVTDENVEQAMKNLREQQGSLVPVEDRGVEEHDYVTADIIAKVNGAEVAKQSDAQVVIRPARVAGVQIADLPAQMSGAKSGDTKTFTAKSGEDHPHEPMRNKDIEFSITVKEIKKLEPVVIDQEFLDSLGFQNEQELRDALREQLVERIDYDVQQAQREQINKYLLDNVQFDLPTKLSTRQADRVVQRRAIDLMSRGMPQEQIGQLINQLRQGAQDEAARELKLFFILQKIATDNNVDVEESELNGRIAMLAAQRGRRPEKMKQEMAKDGSLQSLYIQMREQKAADKILESAEIEEVDVPKPGDEEKK
ncbi:MAG TPA: trigger factor [Tepidisphaeraceae bacterium]|jgi:trigger factor|nr:trigger factor [Tepidisphaeraceae bacterium]